MALSIRDLFITFGFDIDDKPLKALDRNLETTKTLVKGVTVAITGMGIATGFFLKKAGDIEQVSVAFETMTGSVEAAQKLLEDITEFAAKTPFQLTGLIENSKKLLAFGIEAETIIDTMTVLGNIAAGVGRDKLPNIVLAFGKIRTKGKATMEELNILLEAGVPVLDALADKFGVTTQELFKMITAGKVGFEDVNEALTNMTVGSGKFANLMIKQSKTFLGLVSNVLDIIEQLAIGIGQELLPEAKELAKQILTFLEINKKIFTLKIGEFFKGFLLFMVKAAKGIQRFTKFLIDLVEVFGDLKDVIKAVGIAIGVLISLQVLSTFGSLVLVVKNLALAFITVKKTILLSQAVALALPIIIGAAVIALGLIIEDIIAFFQGKDSITAAILKAFDEDLAGVEEVRLKIFLLTVKTIIEDIIVGLGIMKGKFNDFRGGRVGSFIFGDSKEQEILNKTRVKPGGVLGGGGTRVRPGGVITNAQRINAPITITVPEGTSPELVANAAKEGIKEAMDGILRETSRATEPAVEF